MRRFFPVIFIKKIFLANVAQFQDIRVYLEVVLSRKKEESSLKLVAFYELFVDRLFGSTWIFLAWKSSLKLVANATNQRKFKSFQEQVKSLKNT